MNSRHAEIVGLGSPFSYKFILQTKSQTIRDFKYTQSSQRLADLNQVSQSNDHNFYTESFLLSFLFLKALLISPYKVSMDQTGGLNLNVEEITGVYGYWI